MAENFYTYDHQVLFSFSNPGLIELSTAGLVMKIKLIKKWMPALEIDGLVQELGLGAASKATGDSDRDSFCPPLKFHKKKIFSSKTQRYLRTNFILDFS